MIVAEVDGYDCIDNRSTAALLVVKKHANIYPQYRGLDGRSYICIDTCSTAGLPVVKKYEI